MSWDLETKRFEAGAMVPDPVCMSYQWAADPEPSLIHAMDGAMDLVIGWLEDPNVVHVGQNLTGFDLLVVANHSARGQAAVLSALDGGRVRDTQLREYLIATRTGQRQNQPRGYFSLAGMAERYLGVAVAKGEETWRLRYGDLIHTPLAAWPEDARAYALTDATMTARIFAAQHTALTALDYLDPAAAWCAVTEREQCRAAFALAVVSAWGIHTSAEKVRELAEYLQGRLRELEPALQAAGVLRPKSKKDPTLSRDMKLIRELLTEAYLKAELPVPLTDGGQVATDKDAIQTVAGFCPALAHLSDYIHAQKILGTFVAAAAQGIERPLHTRLTSIMVTNRTSSSGPNLQNLPRERGVRQCFVPRPGHVFSSCDFGTLELRTLAQVCLDWGLDSALAAAFRAGPDADPHMDFGAAMADAAGEDWGVLDKAARKEYRQRAKCFHPDTEFLTPRGWMRFDDLPEGLPIMQAHPRDGEPPTLSWAVPHSLFWKMTDRLVRLHNQGIDLRVTDDHRMLAFGQGRGAPIVCAPADLSNARGWWNAGGLAEGRDDIDERVLRLAVATQADGTFHARKDRIRFGFSKHRKIARLRSLLLEGEIAWENPEVSNGRHRPTHCFTLSQEIGQKIRALLTANKRMPWWWISLSERLRSVVLEEARFWDSSNICAGYSFSSTPPENREVLQTIAAITGRKTRMSPKENKLTVRMNAHSRGGNLEVVPVPGTHRVVCLSVPSGFVLVRDGGIPVVVGQCANFGFPGGLGAARMVDYARAYGVTLTASAAKALKAQWVRSWPEMRAYFERIAGMERGGFITIEMPRSGMVRGAARYTEACNFPFQGLAAYGAKAALYAVVKECLTAQPGDALYGSHVVNFIHDELLTEHPEATADRAAARVAEIMRTEMERVTPDVPHVVEPTLMRWWDKEAKPIFDDSGKLIPWDGGAG